MKKKKIKWLYRDALISSILSLLAFALISGTMLSTSYFNPLLHTIKDFSFLDIFYEASFSDKHKISDEIVLINIEDYNRNQLAKLINLINKESPAVVGLDMIFKTASTDDIDMQLAEAISNSNLVTTYINAVDRTIGNATIFKTVDEVSGFVNFDSEGQAGVIRKIQGVQSKKKESIYSFTSQIVKKYKEGVFWDANGLEKKLTRSRRIKYYGHFQDFAHYSASDFIKLKDKSMLKDKLVLIGYLGEPLGNIYDVEDKHFTPLNKNPSGKGIPDMYGLSVHANILNMILLDDFFIEIGVLGQCLLIFLFAYLASMYFIWLDRKLNISYRTVRKLVLFVFAFSFVGFCLWLFAQNIAIEPTLLVMITIFSGGFVKYYKHLVRYVNTKRKFKSYLK